jgi:Tol biopolymer transport system component
MRCLLICALAVLLQAPAAPPDTEIFLAPLTGANGAVTVGRPVNITNSPGYDNQPSFTPDGQHILFTSIRGGTQTDVHRYDIARATIARVTNTPESEYSPTVTPDGRHISVIRVEADGTQRLWRFTMEGTQPEIVLAGVKPVGYHAWVDDRRLVLFVLGQPATLQLADAQTGKSEILVTGIGRSIQPVPRRPGPSGSGDATTITFVEHQAPAPGGAPALRIRELEPGTKRVTPLVNAVEGATEADLAWTPDGTLLMANKDRLYGWRRGDPAWRLIVDLATLGLRDVTRLAVSPKGDRLALVALAR